jgi:hypothetical protein
MVDFSRLNASSPSTKASTLQDTFLRLDRQVSHVELRPSQLALFAKIDERIDQRDLVVKLNTGGGKTTTGLIYLKHMMDRYGEPAVFLVPTTQLAEQVVEEGVRIGLPVSVWHAGEKYPPDPAIQCAAVMACTYDKFFNGKSTFARHDVRLIPCAIVLDDVHAGIESIKKCFGADLSADAREDLLHLLGAQLSEADPSGWSRVDSGDQAGILEVPHWIFADNIASIRATLERHSSEPPLLFSWPYLSKQLELARLVLGGRGAAISLDPPLVDQVEHYARAKHRLFMSASIHDGAPLIRELGCGEAAASEPVQVDGEAAVGERMVLVPSLISPDFSKEKVCEVVRRFVPSANVVVLVPSEAAAKFWVDNGASMAVGDAFSSNVARLKTSARGNFIVFVNRYDGIDLPDAACRILVIDGLPSGDGIIDRLDNENAGGVVGMRGKLANRVEQGLGRAVRSSSDYCAVILAGQDLANFVSRRVVLESFSPNAVRQMEMGREVSRAISSEDDQQVGLTNALAQLLSRDSGWRDYYASQMKADSETARQVPHEADLRRRIAAAERRASVAAQSRDYPNASRELRSAANLLDKDRYARGAIKQSGAKLMYLHDKVGAMDLQGSAFADNYNLSRPPVMPTTLNRRISGQAEAIADFLKDFADKNGALVELDGLATRLRYANDSSIVEKAVAELGRFLGADSSRPEREHGRGPDNLWVFSDRAFCIEMKSDKFAKLWKADGGQISLSERWVRDNLPGLAEVFPIIGSNVVEADHPSDFADHVRVMTEESLIEVVGRLRRLLVSLITQGPLFAEEPANIQQQLGAHGLLPQQISGYGVRVR